VLIDTNDTEKDKCRVWAGKKAAVVLGTTSSVAGSSLPWTQLRQKVATLLHLEALCSREGREHRDDSALKTGNVEPLAVCEEMTPQVANLADLTAKDLAKVLSTTPV